MRDEVSTPRSSLPEHEALAEARAPSAGRVGNAAMMAGGAALLAYAASRRSWGKAGAALAGAAPLIYRGATGHWPVPQTVARRAAESTLQRPTQIETSVTVQRPRREVYDFWRRLENLPRFMKNLQSVAEIGEGRSRWVAHSPLGTRVEWEAEVIEDREGRLLSWRSVPGSQVETAGSVLFEEATGGRGTVVRAALSLQPAGNGLGRVVGRVLRPLTKRQVREDLQRFKSLLEAGEVPTIEGQPAGPRSAFDVKNPF